MTLTQRDAEAHLRQAGAALQQNRPAEARQHLDALVGAGVANIQVLLMLATACRALGDDAAAEEAVDAVLATDPKIARAHIIKADCRAAIGRNAAAIRHYKLAAEAAAAQPVPESLAAELRRAAAAAEDIARRSAGELDDKLAGAGLAAGPRSARFQESLDITLGTKDIFYQQPTHYYFPGLPQRQYFDPADFPWAAEVEAATDAIRAELSACMADMGGFRPYMNSGTHTRDNANHALIDKREWSTLFLAENGALDDALIERCPRTWAAVQPTLGWVKGGLPTVMFSLLRPGGHILPHTGMLNTRLTCHLPLIVPPNCGFRVGNEVREWEEGKLLIFDDTIEHEAWNRSDQDRVVLIFDVWRPELSAQERDEVAALMMALQ